MKLVHVFFIGFSQGFFYTSDCHFNSDNLGEGLKAIGDIAGIIGGKVSDEKCSYSCPRGQKTVPRRGYTAHSNGCGAYGIQVEVFSPEISQCCDVHDICYGTCNKKRSKCDKDFKNCIEKACKRKSSKKRSDCLINSQLLYAGAMALGCQAYLHSQEKACSCIISDEL
ncbi:DgyrCDS4892 [Dimorphilus gyrociliatus]|uniref:DgyrCDS4892 n=1 Tax=Dimorphilus gyrociliatus TaxID=2664684 RepID=A0A7I8VI54_9ANNE|nr:DgyrCDS4892 [Dimorphilus gyrociliatus]